MNRFGKVWQSVELVTSDNSKGGFIRIIGDKPRPTAQHVCSPGGVWVMPERTLEEVEEERRKRYAEETDDLKAHILSDQMLGKPAAVIDPKLAEWQARVNQIKLDLPYPEKDNSSPATN